jgi:repressor LexA
MPRKRDLAGKIEQLRFFYRRERRVPGYKEMLDLFGYRSKNAVYRLLGTLEEQGYLNRDAAGKMSFTDKLTGSMRMLGAVQAGFPSPAEEELVDLINLDEFLVTHPEATFMLTVSGESMIDAGIHPGDLVLVEKGAAVRNSDVVVAQVDGEWTLKYYFKDKTGVRLEPANKRFKTIRPKQSLVIGGVVKAVIRKYQ